MNLRILILSDAHLFGTRNTALFGVDTYRALSVTVEQIKASEKTFDLLVALGDLSEDGSAEAYGDFDALTSSLAGSVIWVRGNHDDFSTLQQDLLSSYCKPEWHRDPWHFIFLDTTLRGKDEGRLGPGEMDRLREFLGKHPDGYILIFMHHQPMLVGSAFIDDLALQDRDQFLNLVAGFRNVKGIVFGHVHQQVDLIYHGMRMLSVPATSMQFKPNSEQLDFDSLQHGYRVLTLSPDGHLRTTVEMVPPG